VPRRPSGYYGARRAAMRAGRGMSPSFRRGAPRYIRGRGCLPGGWGPTNKTRISRGLISK